MPDKSDRSLDKSSGNGQKDFRGIFNNLRLIVRLLKDPRVNFLLKLLPIGALIYLIVPIDFLPINPLEDAAVLWLGGTLFIKLCPEAVVQEHRLALQGLSDQGDLSETMPSDVVDAEFKDVDLKDQ